LLFGSCSLDFSLKFFQSRAAGEDYCPASLDCPLGFGVISL
jgi:hypothetical protein